MPLRKIRKRLVILLLAAILLLSVIWIIWGNTALELNTYTIACNDLPATFDGYRIAHISDLHNTEIGKNNIKLLTVLRNAKPDMIAITGDLIDSRNTDVNVALEFVKEAVKIAPCYYVTGNHESRIPDYHVLKDGLEELGVIVLKDEKLEIQRAGEAITLIGADDPSFHSDYIYVNNQTIMAQKLEALLSDEHSFTVLLSHRPDLFETYADSGLDLVLTGHAHGGQIRIPFVGGIIAPDQGFFPEYCDGLHTKENTSMIISRGIGNSLFPFRFNNRPEVILVELNKTKP